VYVVVVVVVVAAVVVVIAVVELGLQLLHTLKVVPEE